MNRAEIRQITESIKRGETGYLEVVSEGNRYVRKFQPKERLIILGGGHVSMPVCHIAAMLDFEVTVVDDWSDFANYQRFSDAETVICESFRDSIRDLKVKENDYIVPDITPESKTMHKPADTCCEKV